jgi:hypothetical protein
MISDNFVGTLLNTRTATQMSFNCHLNSNAMLHGRAQSDHIMPFTNSDPWELSNNTSSNRPREKSYLVDYDNTTFNLLLAFVEGRA